MNLVYHKQININILAFWRSILRQMLGMVPAFAVGVLIVKWIAIDSWLKLFLFVAVYMVSYLVSVLLFALNAEEKAMVRNLVKKFYPRGV